MKASSNSGGIKNMFLQHVEKIVLGIAVILVGLFLWSAMGVKPIDASKAPEKLLAAANSEKNRIQTSVPPEKFPVPEVNYEVASGLEPVSASHYIHPLKLNPDIQPPIVKRPEPKLFPVEDVRVAATVIAVPEYGTPPVWKEPEKAKKATKKERPGLDPERQRRPRRRGRNQTGYGDTAQPGYGAAGQPGYGATGADRSGGDKAGYGASGPKTGYGASGGAPGYGAAGGGKSGYGAAGGHPGARAEGGSAGYGSAGYGGPGGGAGYGGAGGGYGGAGYGGAGMGMPGGRPGVDISNNASVQSVAYPAVVLTGRVPYESQFDEFQKKFKGTFPIGTSAEQDIPKYMQFKLERQEVTPAGDGKWVTLDLEKAVEAEARWAVQSTDFVDAAYIDPYLTWPLPPTLLRDWGRLASHPSIPFAWMAEEVAPTTITPTQEEIEMRKLERFGTVQQPQGGYGYGAGADGRGAAAYGAGAPGSEMQAMVAHTPYLLFRFVDMQNIVPGKEYRYRVSLEVQNPNYLVPPGILEEPTSSQQESRWTPPAETPSVTVPGKSRLYAMSLKKSQGEPEGHVLFHVFNDKMGAEIAKEFDLALGAIADFIDTVDDWYNPYTGAGEKLENVHFAFKDGPPILADITGGVEVPGFRDLEQPTEMLFIDANGRMFTSNQARGTPAAEFYKERYTLETAPDPSADQFAPEQPGLIQQPTGNYGGAR
jgi:hypothetical protein